MKKTQVYIHASEILTGQGLETKEGRHPKEDDLGRIIDGALVCQNGKIAWVGETKKLPAKFKKFKAVNLKQRRAIVPGLVDCHTHLVFAGDRANEFARRCGGATYEEIAREGGGIQHTVRATRAAKEAELFRLAKERVHEALSFGVRTIEVKSGYGLSIESELKCLRVVKKLKKEFPQVTFVSTFLGAHAFPPEKSRAEYLQELSEMLQVVSKQKLAEACDVFVDAGYFTTDEARVILGQAKKLGLKTKIHADELGCTGSAELAAELGCFSADHLLCVSDDGIRALAASKTVAVLLPGTAFYLKANHAPARKLIDAGARVAVSTDYNPGTCVSLSLPLMMTISALYLKMTRAEIFASVTYNAAQALGLEKRKGILSVGRDADFWVMPFEKFEEAYYRFGWAPSRE